jgi:hydrogenase maturation protease
VGASILVVGFGNRLRADDGAGAAVADRLATDPLPHGVRVEKGGTDSLRLPSLWRGERRVWLVDAAARGAAPGTVHRIDHDTLLALPQRHEGVHHLSLPESLRWLILSWPEMAEIRWRLWGIEPGFLGSREELSPEVAAAVESVAEEIREALAREV